MKLIILPLLFLCAPLFSYPAGDYGDVNDYAGILNPADKEALSEIIGACERECGIGFKLFIIDSVSDYPGAPQNFEDFSRGLLGRVFEGGFSAKAALMIVAVKDRKVTIETGTPLEGRYSQEAEKIIREKVVPYFKNNDYSRGVFTGITSFKLLFSMRKTDKKPPLGLIALFFALMAGGGALVKFSKKSRTVKPEVDTPKKEPAGEFGGGAWGKWQ